MSDHLSLSDAKRLLARAIEALERRRLPARLGKAAAGLGIGAVLTLGPILIGAALALSAQKVLGVLGMEGGIPPGVHRIGIFFLTWLVFSLFFVLVPNRKVRIKHALIGAFLSTVLFVEFVCGNVTSIKFF